MKTTGETDHKKRATRPGEATGVFLALASACAAVIWILIVNDAFTIHDVLSFEAWLPQILFPAFSIPGLLAFGMLLAVAAPSRPTSSSRRSFSAEATRRRTICSCLSSSISLSTWA